MIRGLAFGLLVSVPFWFVVGALVFAAVTGH